MRALRRLWCRLFGHWAVNLDHRGICGAGFCLSCGESWEGMVWPGPPIAPPRFEHVRKGGYNAPPQGPRPTLSAPPQVEAPLPTIAELVAARMQFIAQHRERLVEAWIAETGLKPSESMLVEQRCADGNIAVHVEKRDRAPALDEPALKRAVERCPYCKNPLSATCYHNCAAAREHIGNADVRTHGAQPPRAGDYPADRPAPPPVRRGSR